MHKGFLRTAILFGAVLTTLACSLFAQPAPTATPQPTSTPIPGWKMFEGSGVEIWLPENFDGGDLSQDLEVIVEKLRALGPDFEQIAKTIEQNPSAFAIWAFDTETSESGFVTNVNITKEKVLSTMTMEAFAETLAKSLPSSLKIVEKEMVQLEHYEAMQVVLEMNLPPIQAKEIMYIIRDGNVMWAITYATGLSDYGQWLPIFEQSANTFKLQP